MTSFQLHRFLVLGTTREQVFLHGWIACHANDQGCKELTDALKGCDEKRWVWFFLSQKPGVFMLSDFFQWIRLRYTYLSMNTPSFWTDYQPTICVFSTQDPVCVETAVVHLGTTSHSHHCNGAAQHRDTSITLREWCTCTVSPERPRAVHPSTKSHVDMGVSETRGNPKMDGL